MDTEMEEAEMVEERVQYMALLRGEARLGCDGSREAGGGKLLL